MFSMDEIKTEVKTLAEEALQYQELLTDLDSRSGDGDLGDTVVKLAEKAREAADMEAGHVGELFMKMAMRMNRAAPSTFGTLVASAMMALAKTYTGKTELSEEEVAAIPEIMGEAIAARGKAAPGDKTVLDALVPFAQMTKKTFEETGDLRASLKKGSEAAEAGAESTCGMIAKTGRAFWIADRTQDNPDGGAVFCAKLTAIFR